MYDKRSGHSAKNRNRDDPTELNFAGPWEAVVGVVVGGTDEDEDDGDGDGDGCEVVGEAALPTPGASWLPTQPARVNVAAATTRAAEGSARVMRIRRCRRHDWFPAYLQRHRWILFVSGILRSCCRGAARGGRLKWA
jgi:hypothetical protein